MINKYFIVDIIYVCSKRSIAVTSAENVMATVLRDAISYYVKKFFFLSFRNFLRCRTQFPVLFFP